MGYSKSLKYWANDEPGFIYGWSILQYQDVAKNLTKVHFAQNFKNGSDIYEHFLFLKKKKKKELSTEVLTISKTYIILATHVLWYMGNSEFVGNFW